MKRKLFSAQAGAGLCLLARTGEKTYNMHDAFPNSSSCPEDEPPSHTPQAFFLCSFHIQCWTRALWPEQA